MEIERLNALMFEAEAHRECEGLPWAEFLGHVLADDFALRRSAASKPLEDRDTFLNATRDAQPAERTIVPGSLRVWQSDTVAAVSSVSSWRDAQSSSPTPASSVPAVRMAGAAIGGRLRLRKLTPHRPLSGGEEMGEPLAQIHSSQQFHEEILPAWIDFKKDILALRC